MTWRSEHPEKLRELQRLFLIEAARYNVLPLDDRAAERADPDRAGRPVMAKGPRQRLYPGIGRLNAFCVVSTKNKSYRVTAEVVVPAGGCEGVIVAQGGFPGGWSLYAKEGRLKYCYNFYGIDLFHVESAEPIAAGKHLVRMDFDYDGGGVAKGGSVRLSVDDRPVGQGRVGRTQPLPFASDEPLEIGRDSGSRVTDDYTVHEFTGQVNWVEIEIPRARRTMTRRFPASSGCRPRSCANRAGQEETRHAGDIKAVGAGPAGPGKRHRGRELPANGIAHARHLRGDSDPRAYRQSAFSEQGERSSTSLSPSCSAPS